MNTRTTVTISQLEQGNLTDPIWAVNNSVASKARQQGEVHIGIPKTNGTKLDDLFLPMTWLPICLTDQIPRKQLLDSSEFRDAVNSKVLQLITEEHAKLLLSQDGADEEAERLDERKRQIEEATAARTIQDSGAEIVSMQELADRAKGGASIESNDRSVREEKESPVEPGFAMFVETLITMPDAEALNKIRARNSAKRSEITYMLDRLRHKEKVVAFLRQF